LCHNGHKKANQAWYNELQKNSIRGDLFMKGKQIPALAVLCCALSLTAPVWAAPAVEGLSQSGQRGYRLGDAGRTG
jgi:hypothetical protein